jgi:hypothetical protein
MSYQRCGVAARASNNTCPVDVLYIRLRLLFRMTHGPSDIPSALMLRAATPSSRTSANISVGWPLSSWPL